MKRLLNSVLLAFTFTSVAWASAFGQGLGPKVPITGTDQKELSAFDEMMIKFVTDHQVPGAALAVARNGKVVYTRGFGHADPQLGRPVEPRTRFRIASISKPITAAAILRLIELGLLKLGDNPFQVLQLTLPPDADPRLKKITIEHLLQHTAGWDRAVSFDPMFRSILIAKEQKTQPPAEPMAIIQYMLKQKLDFNPGTRYAYSNFGYCILGRVIEKRSGMTYEAFVEKQIFTPLKIKDTQLGKTLTTAKNEAKYVDEKKGPAVVGPDLGKLTPRPYGTWYLEAMDSHGGWISTAPDLVRFASAFTASPEVPILTAENRQAMFARPPLPAKDGGLPDVYYGLGWQIRTLGKGNTFNAWHTGSLDGTSTLLVRRYDGLCWAVLFNARQNAKGETLSLLIDPLVHRAANQVKRWPERDLFE